MKRKLFMKKSQSRAGSGFARVMTMLTLTLTMLCVQSANAFTLTCLRGSGFGEDEGCQNLFDGTQDTKWGTYDGSYGNPVYAVAKATMPIAPTTYSLKIANDTNENTGRNWKSWRIFGGNFASDADAVYDAEGWVLIDQKVDQQMTTDQFAEVKFDLSNPDGKFYSYFMIVVDAICSNPNWDEYTQMDEFWFRDFKTDLSEALFSVTLKNGTADADKWTIEPVDAKEGDEIKATYTGKLKVKSVKAVKKIGETIDLSELDGPYAAKDGDILTGETSYTISIADGATVTLSGMAVNNSITCLGNATIVLAKGTENRISSNDNTALIVGPAGTTLTIEGEGQLYATGGGDKAGIGSQNNSESGNIVINGGIIEASASYGAAIGAADVGGKIGDITINGGKVTAKQKGSYGAGIGSGDSYDGGSTCGNITITGGTVTATGGNNGAGIGAGGLETNYNSTCGNITITGGKVTAIGGNNAAGIGTGTKNNQASNSSCGNITISGGTVIAQKGEGANYDVGPGNNGQVGTVNVTVSVKDTNNIDAKIYKP